MTKRSSTPANAVLVAIDMSKHRQEVLLERPEGGRRRRMTVTATKADYDRLADDLTIIGKPVIVGFEATGNYHRTLAYRLLSAGFELRLISSVALAQTSEALHNGWDKYDSKDAQVILPMLRIGATQRYVDPLAAGINDLQEMSKTHEAISKAKTQTWHRILTHYLPLYFPEIERFAGNSRSDCQSARDIHPLLEWAPGGRTGGTILIDRGFGFWRKANATPFSQHGVQTSGRSGISGRRNIAWAGQAS